MPDFSTLFRDLGTGPTLIGIGFIALLVYAIVKGGKGSNSGSGSNGSSGSSSAPPTA